MALLDQHRGPVVLDLEVARAGREREPLIVEGAHARLSRLELRDQRDVARQDAELARPARDDDHPCVLDEYRTFRRHELDAKARGCPRPRSCARAGRELLGGGEHVRDVALQVERLLGQIVVLALEHLAERPDRVLEVDVLACAAR